MKKNLFFAVVLLLVLTLSGCKSSDYKHATQLYMSGDYEAARGIFTELGDYEDSAEMVNKCTYEMAVEQVVRKDYAAAADLFLELGDYKDSPERAQECLYEYAMLLVSDNQLEAALDIFAELGDYRDSASYVHGMRWILFTSYIAEQGKVTVTEPYTVVLSMSGDKIYVELMEDYKIGFTGSVLIDQHDPVTELYGTMTIGYGNYPVKINGIARWDISSYHSGDSVQWHEIAYEDLSHLPYSARTTLQQLTAPYFMGSGDAAEIMSRLTNGIQQALLDSGLDVTMADLGFVSY